MVSGVVSDTSKCAFIMSDTIPEATNTVQLLMPLLINYRILNTFDIIECSQLLFYYVGHNDYINNKNIIDHVVTLPIKKTIILDTCDSESLINTTLIDSQTIIVGATQKGKHAVCNNVCFFTQSIVMAKHKTLHDLIEHINEGIIIVGHIDLFNYPVVPN
jgi:hypothetical protein